MDINKKQSGKDLKLNIIIGIFSQILLIFTNLVSKKAVQYCLGIEYLGMQTVFSNISDLLTFTFSAIGVGILYSFIRPIEEKNSKKIYSLYSFYSKIYNIMMWISVIIGVIVAFFIPFIIDLEISKYRMIALYLLYLFATISYSRYLLFHYVLIAYQKRYIVCLISGFIEIVALIFEVILLMQTRKYEYFLGCFIIKNLLINGGIYLYLKNKYSTFLVKKNADELEKGEKKEILINVKDLIVCRVGGVLINNTDSILISSIVNTVTSGYYSNYCFISGGVLGLINSFFESIIAKIGSIAVRSSKEEMFENFWKVSMICLWINGFSVSCFYILIQDFVRLWMGETSILSMQIVLIVTLNLYLDGMRKNANAYRKSVGLFHKFDHLVILRGVINLILSIFLGKLYGLYGILVATTISNITTVYWYTPYRLYKYFEKTLLYEGIYQLLGIAGTTICILITSSVTSLINSKTWQGFFVKALVCCVVSNACYLLFSFIYIRIRVRGNKNECN